MFMAFSSGYFVRFVIVLKKLASLTYYLKFLTILQYHNWLMIYKTLVLLRVWNSDQSLKPCQLLKFILCSEVNF